MVGKALTFDGVDDRLVVAHASSLDPANGLTIELWINPAADPNCDDNNNYRVLLQKGDLNTGSSSVVLEEGLAMQFRVNVDGMQQSVIGPAVPANAWTHVAFEYDGPSGKAGVWHGGTQVVDQTVTAGTLAGSGDELMIGGPGPRAACPNGDGAFAGQLDEVGVSRYARHLGTPPEPIPGEGGGGQGGEGAGGPGSGPGGQGAMGEGGAGGDPAQGDASDGCSCRQTSSSGASGAPVAALLGLALIAAGRTAARARSTRR